jgi:hypothetical protein
MFWCPLSDLPSDSLAAPLKSWPSSSHRTPHPASRRDSLPTTGRDDSKEITPCDGP